MTQTEPPKFGYGLIGCGAFGLFCLEQYADCDAIRPVAVTDIDPRAVRRAADRFGVAACGTVEEFIDRDDVDIVHVATPPITHHDIVTKALRAGKHVLCEKPLATNVRSAREMVTLSRECKRLLAVNLIMRYDPLCELVKNIIDRRLLGKPLHGFFENYATDEHLGPDHWFWDRTKSGGIFIEHGVHFFDLFSWWLGPGEVISASETRRLDGNMVEQVNCTVTYEPGVTVNFYHGFHQAARMDRQEFRILFERGSITLHEWLPVSMNIDCLIDAAALEALKELMPGARVETVAEYANDARRVTSRHKNYEVDRRVRLDYDVGMTKPELYGHVLRALLTDQVAALGNPGHKRRVTEENGFTSLQMACEADRQARGLE